MLTIIDTEICNIASVCQALARIGAPYRTSSDRAAIASATALVLPGVGSFGDAMQALHEKQLVAPLRQAANAGVPLLGICLGMQLLADSSEEHGEHEGLGLIPGRVIKLQSTSVQFRIPNMGWCDVNVKPHTRLFTNTAHKHCYYHVHSFHFKPDDPAVVTGTIPFASGEVAVAIEKDNIAGVQFHPEKSQEAGLDLLASFVASVDRNTAA